MAAARTAGGAIDWRQVGQRDRQFFPGAGARDLPGPLVEFNGCDPAGLQGLAQLRQRPVALGVRRWNSCTVNV